MCLSSADLARLLAAIRHGKKSAEEILRGKIEAELAQLDAVRNPPMGPVRLDEDAGSKEKFTVNTLIDELWRLAAGQVPPESRTHFMHAAAEAIRRVKVQLARKQFYNSRSGCHVVQFAGSSPDELLSFDDALQKFEAKNSLGAELVKLRYFFGFNVEQVAEIMQMSADTAMREWQSARKWLYEKVRKQ